MISMLDLKKQYRELRTEIDAAVGAVLESGHFIMGPNVKAFEKEAAEKLGAAEAIALNSGTDALHLALRAAGIGAGDEVITTPFTFVATVEAILYVGATPVFADIDPRTFNIDPNRVEACITPATRAILPVHLFGLAADMARIGAIAEQHGLAVIEDVAQAFGTQYGGKAGGSMGAAGCFSFYPTKTLGGYGDGGMVVTSSAELAERVRSLRDHGRRGRYQHVEVGYNSRLDEIQAAILRIKLQRIDAHNNRRRELAAMYSEAFAGLALELPVEPENARHVYGQYTILSDNRDRLAEALREAEIASMIYYPIPMHRLDFCREQYQGVSLPVSESVADRCLSLPLYPEMDDSQAQQVIAAVRGSV